MDHSSDHGTASTLPIRVHIPGYRLRRQVGSDALGLWFDAEQESLGRKLTLKVLKPQYEEHEAARREFLAEMDRLAGLDHPNLPRVLDSVREGTLVLVVERLGPGTVADLLRAEKPLGESVSLPLVRDLGRALHYLTTQGLAHKNVTPRLLARRENGGIRIVTFRNIVALDELAALRGRLAQDAHYVAPEQLAGEEPIGPRTHVYNLAALLFHLLAARPPHPGKSPQEIARAHLAEEFPSLRRFQPFLTAGIYDLLEACTAKKPDERLELARAVEALEALADGKDPGLGGSGKKGGIVAPTPRRRRRR